jgi:hypothetical protein
MCWEIVGLNDEFVTCAGTRVSCGVEALEPEDTAKAVAGEDARGPRTTMRGSNTDCVQAVVSWFGVFDLTTIQAQARGTSTLSRETADAPEWRLVICRVQDC